MGQGPRRAGSARSRGQRTSRRDELSEIGASSTAADRGPDGSRSVAVSRQNILLSALDHLEEWLIAILIAAATGLIFVAVVHRYGTGLSIDISKWAAARGIPVLPQLFKS